MEDSSRKVWRPKLVRNHGSRKDSSSSLDDHVTETERQQSISRVSNCPDAANNIPSPTRKSIVNFALGQKHQGNWRTGRRGAKTHGSWRDEQDDAPSSFSGRQWGGSSYRKDRRENQISVSSNGLNRRDSSVHSDWSIPNPRSKETGSSLADPLQTLYQSFGSQHKDTNEQTQNSIEGWNDSVIIITELVTASDWKNLSNMGDPKRMVDKLQQLKSSWIHSIQTDAPFEVVNLALGVLSDVDIKYRYAKQALMKALLTEEFIKRIIRVVDEFKVSWFQIGKDNVLSFVVKLQKNLEFALSCDSCFHEGTLHETISGLCQECVRTLKRINEQLHDIEGISDKSISAEIVNLHAIFNVSVIDMTIWDEPLHPEDFMRPIDVSPNIVHGGYESGGHYIETQLSLLKEDFQRVLREGVQQYLDDPKKKNPTIWAYEGVNVQPYSWMPHEDDERFQGRCDYMKSYFIVTFPRCQYLSNIDWKSGKRFMVGSIIVLTADNFHSYHLALVESTDFQYVEEIAILISFISSHPDTRKRSYLLVEPKAFYEPYHNSMKVLMRMAGTGLPLKQYIVKADTKPMLPAYLHGYHVRRYTHLELNTSQREAFINALTNKMALIQGPPGTGKTYLALQIIDNLVQSYDGTIMIVCYKNHSLDQLLEGLLEKCISVLRIGGGSKNKELDDRCNYKSLRTPKQHVKKMIDLYRKRDVMKSILTDHLLDIKRAKDLTKAITAHIGIVTLNTLKQNGVVKPDLSLPLDEWLLDKEAPLMPLGEILDLIDDINKKRSFGHVKEAFQWDLVTIGWKVRSTWFELQNLEKTNSDVSQANRFWELNQELLMAIDDFCILHYNLTWLSPSKSPEVNSSDPEDYFKLEPEERWALYSKWEDDLIRKLEAQISTLLRGLPELEERISLHEGRVMSQRIEYAAPQVIGLTTTAAAKFNSALACIGPEIVLVEEAAEVLEAHVVASLTNKCQHLIMIGDHQQLKPSTASYEMGTRYRMNVSLFERMINNDMKLSSLTTQHRMRPEISALICPAIYNNLENHHSVERFPDIRGTANNVYFFDHTHLEENVRDSESKRNRGEAKMVVAFASYLIKQGYKPEVITILSTYLEQDRFVRKIVQSHREDKLKSVCCTVVDNYQGEENYIILLSLVRSNPKGKVGFLSLKNRVCVALSRAKYGLFMFGNMTCLIKREPTIWTEIRDVLVQQGTIGTRFPLKCSQHGNSTEVATTEEIGALLHGGCTNPCNTPLPCGHTCKLMCHGEDHDHAGKFKCREQCMERCEKGHTCQAQCSESCPECPIMISTLLECDHTVLLECHKPKLQDYCSEIVKTKLKPCGHIQLVPCNMTIPGRKDEIKCLTDCEQTLDCGHICKKRCHSSDDPDHTVKYQCDDPCGIINKTCPRKHKCTKKCREPCGDCLVNIEKTLLCGHEAEMKCHDDVEDFECTKKCLRKLNCGHGCVNNCNETCGPCNVVVEKTIKECQHTGKFKCSENATKANCTQPCRNIKPCGHQCTGTCKQVCSELFCRTKIETKLPCGHEAKVLCGNVGTDWLSYMADCDVRCQARLPCGHHCKGTCGMCMQGKAHVVCNEICKKPLLCSHTCLSLCCNSYHSCSTSNQCINACWKNETKKQSSNFKPHRGRGKYAFTSEFNPTIHYLEHQIRTALHKRNNEMGKVARGFADSRLIRHVKQIHLSVNKSGFAHNKNRHGEELPALQTGLFKVEFASVILKMTKRLESCKVPDDEKSEIESLLEALVVRAVAGHLIGPYLMTQMQEQVAWVCLFLDVHDLLQYLGTSEDSKVMNELIRRLNETKSSFGLDERAEISRKLQNYVIQMRLSNLGKLLQSNVLADAELRDLFPDAHRFCRPIYHHRLENELDADNTKTDDRTDDPVSGVSCSFGNAIGNTIELNVTDDAAELMDGGKTQGNATERLENVSGANGIVTTEESNDESLAIHELGELIVPDEAVDRHSEVDCSENDNTCQKRVMQEACIDIGQETKSADMDSVVTGTLEESALLKEVENRAHSIAVDDGEEDSTVSQVDGIKDDGNDTMLDSLAILSEPVEEACIDIGKETKSADMDSVVTGTLEESALLKEVENRAHSIAVDDGEENSTVSQVDGIKDDGNDTVLDSLAILSEPIVSREADSRENPPSVDGPECGKEVNCQESISGENEHSSINMAPLLDSFAKMCPE